MELGSLIGFLAGIFFLVFSILLAATFNIGKATKGFIDLPSVMIVFGGVMSATFIAFPLNKALNAFKNVGKIFNPPNLNPAEAISTIIQLANLARKEGILALEEAANNMEDTFLQKGILLIADGTDPELVRNILETELAYIEGRHKEVSGVWEFIGSQGPAWGMLGTLIGLIMMLQDMSDSNSLGPKMSIALVTTFYGSLIANLFANPIANKMKGFSADEMLMKEVLIEGILSIQAGENPRIIEEKLKAFLSPALRGTVQGAAGNPRQGGGE